MRLASASRGVGPIWVGLHLYPQTGLYQRGPLRPRNSVREQREVGHAAPDTERLPLLPGFLAAGTGGRRWLFGSVALPLSVSFVNPSTGVQRAPPDLNRSFRSTRGHCRGLHQPFCSDLKPCKPPPKGNGTNEKPASLQVPRGGGLVRGRGRSTPAAPRSFVAIS